MRDGTAESRLFKDQFKKDFGGFGVGLMGRWMRRSN